MIGIALLFSALTCLAVPPSQQEDVDRTKAEESIREAVYRYQFSHNTSTQQQAARVFFLTLGGKGDDPSEALMARFAGHKPPVKGLSQATFTDDVGVRDNDSGGRGILFRIKSIQWLTETEAEVRGGFYEGPQSASDNTYSVKREDGKWVVTKDVLQWKP
ncbi:MAG: hypothetical protein HY650_02015 [Acidobacteria bacterium]|nr:hypothetical protein [Acidobacteriota bacterium]